MTDHDIDQGPVPEWRLERFLLDALSPEEAAALGRRIADEPDLAARVEDLRRSNAEILARHPPADLAAAIRRRVAASARPSRRGAYWAGSMVLAGVTAVLMLAVPRTPSHPDGIPPVAPDGLGGPSGAIDVLRVKGEPQLVVVRVGAGGRQTALVTGDVAQAGEVLQVGYRAADAAYGAIWSIDGRQQVTRHLGQGTLAAPLTRGGLVALDRSFALDDAPSYERFVFVAGPRPFALAPLERALREGALEEGDTPGQPLREGAAAGLVVRTLEVRKLEVRKAPR